MVLHPDTSNSRELFLTLNQRDTERLDIEIQPSHLLLCFPLAKINRKLRGKGTIEVAPMY